MWSTGRRAAGILVAGALMFSAGMYAYWGSGGTWALAEMQDGPPPLRGVAWILWGAAFVFALWAVVVVAAAYGVGGRTAHKLLQAGCWGIAVALLLLGLPDPGMQSAWERVVFGPVALVLSICAGWVAWGLRHKRQPRRMLF
jgi:hypothetical protein